MYTRYTFSSNHNIYQSLCGLCFWAPDPLINSLSIKWSGVQKKATRTLMNAVIYYEKSISDVHIMSM